MKNRSPLLKKLKIAFNRIIGKRQWVGEWKFTHLNIDGSIKDQWCQFNALADEGEQQILDTYFRDATEPTSFYIRLVNDTPVETDTIADLTGEPSGNGYSAQALARNNTDFPTLALSSGDYQVTSKTVTFTASGGSIGAVTYGILTTSTDSSGKLIAYVALSGSRTLASGESLQVTFSIKLQ